VTQRARWKATQNSLAVNLPSRSSSAMANRAFSRLGSMLDLRRISIAVGWSMTLLACTHNKQSEASEYYEVRRTLIGYTRVDSTLNFRLPRHTT
jgi:hypothetical protein